MSAPTRNRPKGRREGHQGKAAAGRLWDKLASGLLMAEEALKEIIDRRTWEPLGYGSFTEAWADRVSHIRLTEELRTHVVYAMFDEGATVEDVAETVKGAGPDQAESLKQQKDAGVPSDKANPNKPITVTQHGRNRARRSFVTIEISAAEMRRWEVIAKARKTTVNQIAAKAAVPVIRAAFKALK